MSLIRLYGFFLSNNFNKIESFFCLYDKGMETG